MKLSIALSALLFVLPLVSAVPANRGGNNNKGAAAKAAPAGKIVSSPAAASAAQATTAAAAAASKGAAAGKGGAAAASAASASAAAATTAAAAGNAGAAAAASAASASAPVNVAASTSAVAAAATSIAAASSANDLQTSLTLDPGQVQPGLAFDGQETPTAGQVASKTSINNFINFCATLPNLPLTNGQQIITGSCNPTIMGVIVAKANMPSGKIINPPNFSTILSNTSINFQIAVRQMNTGHFTNADLTFLGAPQEVDGQGQLIAHSHVTVNSVASLQDPNPADPTKFNFFKGLNDAAVNGILSATATGGLPAGVYRACTLNTGANHQPALVAVAQHASLDDCTYFTVTDDPAQVSSTPPAAGAAAGGAAAAGAGAGAGAAAGAGAGAAAGGAAAASSASAAAASTTAAAASSAASSAAAPAATLKQTGANGGAKPAAAASKKPAFQPPNRGGRRFRGGRNRGRL